MHTAIGNHHNMNRKALRAHGRDVQPEKNNVANAYTLAALENSNADAPLARPTKLFSRTESSSASVFTTADSTYYSRPSSQPSTPTSTVPSDRGKRGSDNAIAPASSRPESLAPSSVYGHDTDDWESGSDTQTQQPLPELEAPSKIHLRLRQERPPTRDFLFFTPKPGSPKHEKEERAPEESRAQGAAIANGPDNTQIEQTHRRDHPDSVKAHGYEKSQPLTFPSTQLPLKERKVDVDGSLKARARRKILAHKHSMQVFQVTLNGFCIFSTWWWPRYYYILLPLITATVAINVAMVASLIIRAVWNKITPEKIIRPETPESMVFLIPCYNETKEELTRSLESLVAQRKIDNHKKAIMIVCDGKVRGPGMEKSTGDYLLQDILTNKVERKYIKGAYTAWDQQPMDIVVQRGKYQGVPYYCIIKQQNQGKRDGLIVVRSFLYNFNRRVEKPNTVFAPEFFNDMCSFLVKDGGLDNCVHLIGMDADTVFDDDCIYHLLEESRYAHTVGVCGYVAVDWKDSNWNLWRLYQSAEYTIAQCLRRLHQSMVTHKVSCLPGCCQLLRICEETCGDHVLLELFGYCPVQTDGLLKQIRATASEDRNHVCHMLTARPKVQTRQAFKAKAYTDVPQSWSVFLSQRRRWTLGATSNDLLLAFARGVQWFERILALVNVVTWILNPFIIASLASFIFAILTVQVWIIMCFVGVMLIPIVYYIIIPIWLTKSWTSRIQFWTGLCMYIFMGPFLNIAVLLYASFYMDSFGWGKTRKVISDEEGASNCGNELQRLEKGEASTQSGSSSTCVEGSSQASVGVNPIRAVQQPRDCADEEKNIGC